jgi:hypothetical protein
MPLGSERRAARQVARALNDLAKTEAWLEGETRHSRSMIYVHEQPRNAVGLGV